MLSPFSRCGIVGLGLMGGAFARSLKKIGIEQVYAYDTNEQSLATAYNEGIIDAAFTIPELMLAKCDLVFICIYPQATIRFLKEHTLHFKSASIITDICGVKQHIAAAMAECMAMRPDIDCIPGHPMAGSEKEGFAHSHKCHFTNRNYILTPIAQNKTEHVTMLKTLITHMGFTSITEVTPEIHDKKIAFTSQLCHLIACSLIDCESDTSITSFGGGSFEDLTRIAMINAPMWSELCIENKEALRDRLAQFKRSLAILEDLVYTEQYTELEQTLAKVRTRRSAMGNTTAQERN